jgi:formylglycine-generating enzyme required for sulfatase activity
MRRQFAKLITAVSCLMLFLLICPGCRRSQNMGTAPQVIKTSSGLEMVVIPAGWFEMGSAKGAPDETPAHRVWVDSFLMDRYEVIQEQYTKLVGANPSSFKGPGRPVDTVTWTDAVLYCNLRSRAEGLEPCYDEKGKTWQNGNTPAVRRRKENTISAVTRAH